MGIPLEIFQQAHLKLLCLSVPNNFAGILGLPAQEILKFVRDRVNLPKLMTLASGPTLQALAEKLLRCAVDSGDTEVADYLLKNRQVNVNEEIFVDNGR